MPNIDQPCKYCGKTWRVRGDAGSSVCQLCRSVNLACRDAGMVVCVRCGDVIAARGASKFCPPCGRWRAPRYPNNCERCGKNCKGARCAKCRLIVPCSCGCGLEARLSSFDYGKPGATARANSCPTRERSRSLTCEHCGATYETQDKRKGRRFCSLQCSQENAKSTQSNRVRGECEVCGAEFYRKASDFARRDGNTGGRFCSKRCHGVHVSSESAKHRAANPKPPRPPKPPRSRVYFRECKMCGRLFCGRTPRACYCSAQCRIDDANVRVTGLYNLATRFDKRSGTYTGGQWRKVLLQYLVERDGDRCGICNRKVDVTLKSGTRGSRRGPSVDHIVPRSLGGSDDPSNLRLAHWGCNQKRGNRGKDEQLALVG